MFRNVLKTAKLLILPSIFLFGLLIFPTRAFAQTGWTCCNELPKTNPDDQFGSAGTDCGQGPALSCPNGCCGFFIHNPGQGSPACNPGTVSNACGTNNPPATPTPVPTVAPTPPPPADPLECYESCTSNAQCRSPFVCGATSTGNRCIYPGYPADSTCRQLPLCNSTCNTSDGCGFINHTVRFVPKFTSNNIYFVFDEILDDNVSYANPSPRLTFSGSWSFVNNRNWPDSVGAFHSLAISPGGNNAEAVFTTTSKKIKYYTTVGPQQVDVDVYVDGQLRTTIPGNSATWDGMGVPGGAASLFEINVETTDNGYGCFNNVCRLSSDPTNPACLTCQGVTRNIANPKFGDSVVYTLAVANPNESLGRNVNYKGKCDVFRSGSTTAVRSFDLVANGNTFAPFTINEAGSSYQCKFQYCYTDNRDNVEYCTAIN